MKRLEVLIALAFLAGCVQGTASAPPPPADPQEVFRQQELELREAETCGRVDLDQATHNWCVRRQQVRADQAAQAERERADSLADEDRRRRERREGIDRAFAPWRTPAPPIVAPQPSPTIAPPRTCTSLVNGNLVSTTCN